MKIGQFICITVAITIALSRLPTAAQTNPISERGFIYGGFAWSPDGSMIAIASQTGVWVYDTENFEVVQHKASEPVNALDWNPTHSLIASHLNRNVEVWEVNTGETILSLNEFRNRERIVAIKWNPDGKFLAVATSDDNIRIWNTHGGLISTLYTNSVMDIASIDWSNDGKYITASGEIRLMVWEAMTSSLLYERKNDFSYCVAWHPLENNLAIGNWYGGVEILQALTGATLVSFETERGLVRVVAWSPTGKYLAGVVDTDDIHKNDQLYIWNTETNTLEIMMDGGVLTGDSYNTNALSWSPDGSKLGMVSDDGKFYLWDGHTFELIGSYQLHDPLPYLIDPMPTEEVSD